MAERLVAEMTEDRDELLAFIKRSLAKSGEGQRRPRRRQSA